MKTIKEIRETENKITDRVLNLKYDPVESNAERGISREAQELTKQIIEKHGKDKIHKYGDFDWGLMVGNLSVLRWLLGDYEPQ